MAEILSLAYYGDAVIELMTREYLINKNDYAPGKLVKRSKEFVTCEAQSDALERILNLLNEEEMNIYRRGRNAKTHFTPRHGEVIQYRRATGFEALFGYLYSTGREERARELFKAAYAELLTEKSPAENTP